MITGNFSSRCRIWFVFDLLIAVSVAAAVQLPTGVRLDPAGRAIAVGNFPLAMVAAPDGNHVVLVLSGWKTQGLQVVDIESGSITQTIEKPSAFFGIVFSADGKNVYASGGNDDVIYAYAWRNNRLADERAISLKIEKETRYPAGIALSPDGRFLYIAENIADDIAVLDLAAQRVIQRIPTEHYPYGIAVSADGRVYVSAWGGESVALFRGGSDGRLSPLGRIVVGRHPSAILLSPDGLRLYVALASRDRTAVVDTATLKIHFLDDPPPAGVREGSTPNALAVPPEQSPLFVAEADSNSIAVFAMNKLIGRIPTDWYPAGIIAQRNRLLILSAKGDGTHPNPTGPTPEKSIHAPGVTYTLGLINGSIRVVDFSKAQLPAWSKRVAANNHWTEAAPHPLPPFKHVIYIIKENRTYDQLLGDLKTGDGDPSLVFFGRDITPNHHALAERFGIFDRFFTNAEVSSQGHVWSTAAYVTDYGEKTIPSLYSDKRPDVDEGDADEPAEGYLWNRAIAKGVSLRNYGEFVNVATKKALKRELDPDTSRLYPSYDLKIQDQKRADAWIEEFNEYVRTRTLPALEIMHLPNDHTAGGRAGMCTPRACLADNDLALGRIVATLSNSPYWRDTIMFVLEDDAQDGADHVDSHRSVLLVISAYNRGGVVHRFLNTTDVVATIERILKLTPMSQFDTFGRPLDDIFNEKPDLTPYAAITPSVSLDEKNPEKTPAATKSSSIDLSAPDRVNDAEFNQILWEIIKGSPPPAVRHTPAP